MDDQNPGAVSSVRPFAERRMNRDNTFEANDTYEWTLGEDAFAVAVASLEVHNNSSYTIERVYISPSSSSSWGTDQLGSDVISSGESVKFNNIPVNTYKVKAVTTDSPALSAKKTNVELKEGKTASWTLDDADFSSSPGDTGDTGQSPGDGKWLAYDDETYEDVFEARPEYWFLLVRFDRPSGWNDLKVTKVRIKFRTSDPDSIDLRCFNTQYEEGDYYPDSMMHVMPETGYVDPSSGWNEWDVNWTVDLSPFCVGYFQAESSSPDLHVDKSNGESRSYLVTNVDSSSGIEFSTTLLSDVNWAIQVYVQDESGLAKAGENPKRGRWLYGEPAGTKGYARKNSL